MSFLYFHPSTEPTDIHAEGLAYAFDGQPIRRDCRRGPGDSGGCVLADPSVPAHLVGYYPDKQVWTPIPQSRNWVGYWIDHPPSPESLARKKQLQGHLVDLNGSQWLIPVARRYQENEEGGDPTYFVALPTAAKLDERGNWINGSIREAYQPLWEAANRWLEAYIDAIESMSGESHDDDDERPAEIDYQELNDSCVIALTTNYRIHRVEASILELFDGRTRGDIMLAVIDEPTRLALIKKKLPGVASNTQSGVTAEMQTTVPA